MKLNLRPYQHDALNKLRQRLKEVEHPLLVNASVGAGKSLIIAELLLILEHANMRALCLTLNSELIRQNAKAYKNQGGSPSIYCNALKEKDTTERVIFASPNSVVSGIKKGLEISLVNFNMIIVDEAHNINPDDIKTMYMRIINHYAAQSVHGGYKFRVVGLTGTPYRGKSISILGHNQFFKEEVCSIDTSWLIEQGYLVNPVFGYHKAAEIDFCEVKVNSFGQFNGADLNRVLKKHERLTAEIMGEVIDIVESEKRCGAFIFASTRDHAKECMHALPECQSALITGETETAARIRYIEDARAGRIKYLVNVNVLTVGIDIPNFDTVVFVRPTESLILYTQAIGRGLRLYEGKKDALILDYAGNLRRHGDIDNPIINAALQQRDHDSPDYCVPCYKCATYNKVTARRCVGIVDKVRCSYYFDWKDCPQCLVKNDISARKCRKCGCEIVDPNKKLKKRSAEEETFITLKVQSANYWVVKKACAVFYAQYQGYDKNDNNKKVLNESYTTSSKLAKNIFYASFVKKQFNNPSRSYYDLGNAEYLVEQIEDGQITTPKFIIAKKRKDGTVRIIKKVFNNGEFQL